MTARTELSPDFSSATTSEVVLPGSDLKKTQAVFTDPTLAGYSAVVINDSLPPSFEVLDPQERAFNSGERLTTMVVRFPRCVLSEFNTHRVFCLAGDAELEFDLPTPNSGNTKVYRMTIAEFVEKWHNGDKDSLSELRIRQLDERTGGITNSTVKNCVVSGEKDVYEVHTKGTVVAGSKDHLIYTTNGYVGIEDIVPGETEVIVRAFGESESDLYGKPVVVDSVEYRGKEQTYDLEIDGEFPNFVADGVVVHNSRNSASSRARSMSVTIKELMEDPYIPLFTRNQRGMGGKYLTAAQREVAVEEWLKARDAAVAAMFSLILADTSGGTVDGVSDADGGSSEDIVISADTIRDTYPQLLERYSQEYKNEDTTVLSVHKQNANRILEPFMWHEVIVSATDWENYFQLRNHDEAQPEIRAIARLMKDAMDASTPVPVWAHTPFEDEGYKSAYASGADYDTERMSDPDAVLAEFMDAFMSSAGDCARVSYKSKLAQGSTDSTKLGYRLLDAGHLSPFEHVAVPVELMGLNGYFDSAAADDNYSSHWIQFRTLLALTQHGTGSAGAQG